MKRFATILIIIVVIVLTSLFDLLSRYSFLTAYYELLTIGLVYPQCEFTGTDLERLNSISTEMGVEVRSVDCDLFYTRGMDDYYQIMTSRIEKKKGLDWLNELHK